MVHAIYCKAGLSNHGSRAQVPDSSHAASCRHVHGQEAMAPAACVSQTMTRYVFAGHDHAVEVGELVFAYIRILAGPDGVSYDRCPPMSTQVQHSWWSTCC